MSPTPYHYHDAAIAADVDECFDWEQLSKLEVVDETTDWSQFIPWEPFD